MFNQQRFLNAVVASHSCVDLVNRDATAASISSFSRAMRKKEEEKRKKQHHRVTR